MEEEKKTRRVRRVKEPEAESVKMETPEVSASGTSGDPGFEASAPPEGAEKKALPSEEKTPGDAEKKPPETELKTPRKDGKDLSYEDIFNFLREQGYSEDVIEDMKITLALEEKAEENPNMAGAYNKAFEMIMDSRFDEEDRQLKEEAALRLEEAAAEESLANRNWEDQADIEQAVAAEQKAKRAREEAEKKRPPAIEQFYGDDEAVDTNLAVTEELLPSLDEATQQTVLSHLLGTKDGFLLLNPRDEKRREKFLDYGFCALIVELDAGTRIERFITYGKEGYKGTNLVTPGPDGVRWIMYPVYGEETEENRKFTLGAVGVNTPPGSFPFVLRGKEAEDYIASVQTQVQQQVVHLLKDDAGKLGGMYILFYGFARPGFPLSGTAFKQCVHEAYRVLTWFLETADSDDINRIEDGVAVKELAEGFTMDAEQESRFEQWWASQGGSQAVKKELLGEKGVTSVIG